jgi:hypothetical protein
MTDKQIQMLIDRTKKELADMTKEDAISNLQWAGILDENGKLTPAHKYLPAALALARSL